LGPLPDGAALKGSPRIWIHAVSVGEVTAAAPIVSALREEMPAAHILVSTSTETGQVMVRNIMTDATAVIYYPLDFPFAVNKVLDWTRPEIVVLTETELWPNFIGACRRRGIKVVMVNGRISPRSFKRYRATRFFLAADPAPYRRDGDDLRYGCRSDQSHRHAPARVSIMGNAKYDGLAARVSASLAQEIAGKVRIGTDERVLVAGSTHEGEEDIVLDVYGRLRESYPDMKLIIVPRHIERGRASWNSSEAAATPTA